MDAGGPQQTSMAVRRRNTSSEIFACVSRPERGTNITASMAEGVCKRAQKVSIVRISEVVVVAI